MEMVFQISQVVRYIMDDGRFYDLFYDGDDGPDATIEVDTR